MTKKRGKSANTKQSSDKDKAHNKQQSKKDKATSKRQGKQNEHIEHNSKNCHNGIMRIFGSIFWLCLWPFKKIYGIGCCCLRKVWTIITAICGNVWAMIKSIFKNMWAFITSVCGFKRKSKPNFEDEEKLIGKTDNDNQNLYEKMRQAESRLKETQTELVETEKANNDLKLRLVKVDATISNLKKEKDEAVKGLKGVQTKIGNLAKEKEDAIKRLTDWQKQNGVLKKEKDDAMEKFKDSQKQNGVLKKEKENTMGKLKEVEARISSLTKEKECAEKRFKDLEEDKSTLKKEKEDALFKLKASKETMDALKKEKDDALNRLSALMGDKLRDNNPAITNLNDPNRPMKLGEKFGELYENEWTDAFENLTDRQKLPENEAINLLITITKEIYEFSREEVSKQLSGHKSKMNGSSDDEIGEYIKVVKESIKLQAPAYVPLLIRKITSDMTNCPKTEEYKEYSLPFIKSCVMTCYLAAVQNPQVYFDFEPQETFDKSFFREYTKSGSKLDFLVWPAMFLHKGGALLCKGVVQPM